MLYVRRFQASAIKFNCDITQHNNHKDLLKTMVRYLHLLQIDFKPYSLCMMRFSLFFFFFNKKGALIQFPNCDQDATRMDLTPLGWPTVQPAGQEQSPVMWWHVPPFWQGQLCSQWKPWLPEGHRSPQLSHASQESDSPKGKEKRAFITESSD